MMEFVESNDEMIGKKIYIFLESVGVVQYEIHTLSKDGKMYHVNGSSGKRKIIAIRNMLQYSPTPEEAKIKWYKDTIQKSNDTIEKARITIQAAEEELKHAKTIIGYDSLKQEHPELLV